MANSQLLSMRDENATARSCCEAFLSLAFEVIKLYESQTGCCTLHKAIKNLGCGLTFVFLREKTSTLYINKLIDLFVYLKTLSKPAKSPEANGLDLKW